MVVSLAVKEILEYIFTSQSQVVISLAVKEILEYYIYLSKSGSNFTSNQGDP